MAYVISDDCVACGSCAEVCPADAISEGDGKYVIDADACLECGTCEAECPNDAISAEYFDRTSTKQKGIVLKDYVFFWLFPKKPGFSNRFFYFFDFFYL